VLQHLGAEDCVEGAVLHRQRSLEVTDDIRWGGATMHASRPVLGPVVAVREEQAVRGQPRPGIKDTGGLRQRPGEAAHEADDDCALDRGLRDEGIQGHGGRHGTAHYPWPVPEHPLTIAVLGGIPRSLGGGGLEIQRDRTVAALRRRGHDVFAVSLEDQARPFDLLHVFGSEVDVCHQLTHWRRNPAPLVISPVIVAAPGAEEGLLRTAARVPLLSLAPRLRAVTLRRAQLLIALTEHEKTLLDRLAPRVPSHVLGNGVDALSPATVEVEALGLSRPYAVLLGTVSPRKQQASTVGALAAAGLQPVVVGGFDGTAEARIEFEGAVARADGVWLDEVHDARVVRALLRSATALVHLSRAEGQSLAVLEALSVGTPVICSPLPANRELASAYPRQVVLCADASGLRAAVVGLPTGRLPTPPVPSWDDVGRALEPLYRVLVRTSG
jgi:glycosyltransferase involved in cell wall biosynthesis